MDDERTEQASPRKRQQARDRGEGPRSKELNDALNLLAGFITAWMFASYAVAETARLYTSTLLQMPYVTLNAPEAGRLFIYIISRTLILSAPVVGVVLVVTLMASLAQSGMVLTTAKLEPKLDRLSPVRGFQRLFSMRGTVETIKNVLKMTVAGIILYSFLRSRLPAITTSLNLDPVAMVPLFGRMAFDLGMWLIAFLLILAVADYAYQRYEFEKSIRMSKKEVRDELKQTEGDPYVRRRIRERARQIAMTRMLAEVPQADVVITNPTHYAVALRYAVELGAPTITAKGADAVALRIRQIAEASGVYIEESPQLAQALWKTVDVGDQIPVELYEVLAEILARVYAAQGRKVA